MSSHGFNITVGLNCVRALWGLKKTHTQQSFSQNILTADLSTRATRNGKQNPLDNNNNRIKLCEKRIHCLAWYHHDPALDKHQKMDGWRDGWMDGCIDFSYIWEFAAFPCLNITVLWICLGFRLLVWQNKTYDYITLELLRAYFTVFWCFIDKWLSD